MRVELPKNHCSDYETIVSPNQESQETGFHKMDVFLKILLHLFNHIFIYYICIYTHI